MGIPFGATLKPERIIRVGAPVLHVPVPDFSAFLLILLKKRARGAAERDSGEMSEVGREYANGEDSEEGPGAHGAINKTLGTDADKDALLISSEGETHPYHANKVSK